jgi:histidinol phosphatase-like enzyme
MNKTILLDIDGTLIPHNRPLSEQHYHKDFPNEPLKGVLKKLMEWERKGYRIVLTTGRRECWRKFTVKQLEDMGIWYDQLVMGLGSGPRILINDLKPGSEEATATAINLPRNQGIGDLEI